MEQYLLIEDPASRAVVEFLSCPGRRGTTVTLEVAGGHLWIKVCVSHGEDAYSWDEHEYEINIAATDDE